ncbi:hypothetical protein DM48_6764 [Burkholderia gladioli]|uniref:Lipoprotein n=1 Tax=Burkholderia gladioli TaxID=28095 RepID=A0AAW3ERU1_BURGA|nr:hypothetical protein DM48_6764 [Burkholderia gladioli]
MKSLPITKRIICAVMHGIRAVANVVQRTGGRTASIPSVRVDSISHDQVSKLHCKSNLSHDGQDAREQCAERQNSNGKLHRGSDDRCNEKGDQVAPHDLPVDRPTASRRDERCKDRENHGSQCSNEIGKYVIHDKRPHTQLMLTLRLIWRSGKRIRHNTMARGINSLMPRIRRFSAVSRVRLAVLTIPALLLCACASAHGDDACSAPYASAGQHLHGGRPA